MNTDTLQLIGQVILIGLGPVLAKHGITLGNNDLDEILGGLSTLGGIIWKFWHWNATPGASQPVNITHLTPILALAAVLFGFGCAHLQPGADPVVVNVERFETTAKSTFDFAGSLDKTLPPDEAKDFHTFCSQQLFVPQTVEQTNTLPRCYAVLLALDDVKRDYKASRASSNDVYTVLSTGQSMLNQASAFLITVTNSATK